ncbi:MAG: PQQ-like beta-propeller repeat protein [Armatimonadota bacterium]|nr:MAG: PQQ-like beta-propeller repeat protein [Armatimonadota bacterium]
MSDVKWLTRGILAVGLALALSAACAGADLERAIVWSAKIAGGVGSSPVPYPSADAPDSVVITTGDNKVVRLDAKGEVIFEYDLGDGIGAVPACGDVDGDGSVDIVAGTVRGYIVCLTGDGHLNWSCDVRYAFVNYACVVLSERPGGGCDVLLNNPDGWLTCLDPNGRIRWRYRIAEEGPISSPAAADLNGDGKNEFVSGIDAERIVALTNDGRLFWEFADPHNFGRCHAVVADVERDGKPEVFMLKTDADSMVHCLDGAIGRLLWAAHVPAKGFCALTVADINRDGFDEILVGTKYNELRAFSHTGEPLWVTTMGGHGIFWSSAVADVDGNGELEIVVGVRQSGVEGNSLYVLDTAGNVLGAYPQEGEANVAPMVADLDRDGALDVVSCSRNTVFAYHFGSPAKAGEVLWPCYRGNSALNGNRLTARAAVAAAAKAAAAREGRLLPATFEPVLGDTPVTATWEASTPRQGYVEIAVTNPRGVLVTQAFRTTRDEQSVEVLIPFRHRGRYQITARLLDTAARRVLFEETRALTYESLAAERRMVEEAIADLEPPATLASSVPHISAGLERRRAQLRAMLATLQARVAQVSTDAEFPEAVVAEAAALRSQIGREKAFAEFARGAAENAPDLRFIAWHDANPWDDADPRDDLPQATSAEATFAGWAYGNQREDFCLNLLSLSPDTYSVRIEPQDLVGPGEAKAPWQEHLSVLEVVWMPTRFGGEVPDMLPEMNPGRTVQLAPSRFAQVWLVVDTKGLAPGEWSIPVRLQSLTMSAEAVDVTLRLDVLPVELPYPYPWKMCNWAWPMGFPQPLRDRVIRNLISHGSNVMYANAPARQCDEQGELIGEVDWSQLDALVAVAKPGDPFLFFTSLPLSAPQGMTREAPEWKKAFKAWMQEFVAHLASIGITYRDFAFYPVDEPGNSGHSGIEQLIAEAKILREADPNAPVYADPAGAAYTLEWIRELDPWVDVWAPSSGLSNRADFHAVMSARNRHVWMYDAPGNIRVLSPLGFYRRQPWVALRNGARGSGFWVYYYSDLWGVGEKNEPDYGTVHIDRTQVVDARRWRSAHDGVQDVTAVLLLDDAVAEAETAGVDAALCERARTTRAEAVNAVSAGWDEDLPELSWEVLKRERRRVADALVGLRRAIAAKQG